MPEEKRDQKLNTIATSIEASQKLAARSDVKIDVPPGFTSSFTSTAGYEVHSLISHAAENRPKIVMIHGALASRRYLLPTAKLLAKDFQVYVPEMPGHGASSRPKQALTVLEQAGVLMEWFVQHELENVYVFANSYGCQVAAQLAAIYPQLVDRLILTGPTCDRAAPTIMEQAYRLWLDGFHEPKGAGHQLIADLTDMSVRIAFQTAERMVSDDIRPKLAQITCLTLVLRGTRDTIAPQNWLEEIASRLTKVRVETIENAPHCVNYAAAGKLTELITSFIAEA
jgi:pimeloyl-ACP methyl ester carboxylesterase